MSEFFFAILKNCFDNKPFPICMPKPHLQVKNGSFSSAIENLSSQLLLACCLVALFHLANKLMRNCMEPPPSSFGLSIVPLGKL